MSVKELNSCGLPNPAISIITPTWNLEGWRVRNCLWSLRQQTEQNVEAIIVDINSDTEHLENMRQLSERFDATLYHVELPTWSIAIAYNIGLRRSRGKYAATIDADIIFERRAIEDTLKVIGNEQSLAVIRQPSFLGGGVDCSSLKFPECYEELSKQPSKYVSPSVGSFTCAPLKWWNKVRGYDERFAGYGIEDWEMWRRLSRDRMRRYLIGYKFNGYTLHPPERDCKLYHQPHPQFRERCNMRGEEYDAHRRSNRLIYDSDLSIVRNNGNWGMMDE